jgi:hypothetical protein
VIVRQREFGLSPSSRLKVSADAGAMTEEDEILDAVFNKKTELLVPPGSN